MFLTAQEKDEDDDSDDETRDDGDKGTGGDAQDIEMEDVHDANAAAGSIDSDSDGSDADNEQEEGGALTQAYPMPTSPGISDSNGVNTPENSPHRSRTSDNADVDVDVGAHLVRAALRALLEGVQFGELLAVFGLDPVALGHLPLQGSKRALSGSLLAAEDSFPLHVALSLREW